MGSVLWKICRYILAPIINPWRFTVGTYSIKYTYIYSSLSRLPREEPSCSRASHLICLPPRLPVRVRVACPENQDSVQLPFSVICHFHISFLSYCSDHCFSKALMCFLSLSLSASFPRSLSCNCGSALRYKSSIGVALDFLPLRRLPRVSYILHIAGWNTTLVGWLTTFYWRLMMGLTLLAFFQRSVGMKRDWRFYLYFHIDIHFSIPEDAYITKIVYSSFRQTRVLSNVLIPYGKSTSCEYRPWPSSSRRTVAT